MVVVIAVYGLVVSVLIAGNSMPFLCPHINHYVSDDVPVVSPSEPYSLFAGFVHLAAGLGESSAGLGSQPLQYGQSAEWTQLVVSLV